MKFLPVLKKNKKTFLFHSCASLPAVFLCPISRDHSRHHNAELCRSYGSSVLLFLVLHSVNASWEQISIPDVLRIAQQLLKAHFINVLKGLSW